ncbi:MAG: hypothetical protein AB7F35_30335 [Acetobacteraceae bacterium]
MDAFIQLALMAKAKLVFESPETFLSFPALTPLSYPPDQLRRIGAGKLETPQDTLNLSEFARVSNQIPRGVIAPVVEGEYLWDICAEALAMGHPAIGALDPAGQARLEAARAVLYLPDTDRTPTPLFVAYRQHRDAHIAQQEEYRNRQFTAETSTDPAVRSQWSDVDEPRMRQELQQIMQDWLTEGGKAAIEEALQVEQACAASSPVLTWEDWKRSFVKDIDMQTDTSLISYAPTGFTPYNVFDLGAWPRFTLTAAEVQHLVRTAPPELLDIFGTAQPAGQIDSVSFEYRSIALTRSWLPKLLFESRFWRLATAGGELSDGSSGEGRCPSYVAALVLARNLEVKWKAGTVAPSPPIKEFTRLQPALLRSGSVQLSLARTAVPSAAVAGTAARPAALLMQQAAATPARVTVRQPTPAVSASIARLATPVRPVSPRLPPDVLLRPPIRAFPLPTVPNRPAPPPPPPATPATDAISILAFICKRVPRCPDPDPALQWN